MSKSSNELKKIKKLYGENFMKLCRTLFPTILDEEGKLTEILEASFSTNSKTLYEDIIKNKQEANFKNYIYNKAFVYKEEEQQEEKRTPYEILEEAGYDLYECKTYNEILKFKKYYAPSEEICTFKPNENRLDRSMVFFAVKKDVDNIKRENFENPEREDEYSTSVLGIQFSKDEMCTASIISRYNHRVINPNSTYGNDLNKIAPCLEASFRNLLKERGYELNTSNKEEVLLPGYVIANDEKYYKFNTEISGKYYCPGNVVIDNGNAFELDKDNQLLIDYFLVNTQSKTVELFDSYIGDGFTDDLKNIKSINIKNDKKGNKGDRIITIQKEDDTKPVIIKVNEDNQIIEYENHSLKEMENNFLEYSESLTKLNLSSVEYVGPNALAYNKELKSVNLPNVKKIDRNFMAFANTCLKEINISKVEKIGNNFLSTNYDLEELNLPNVKEIGFGFLQRNKSLKRLNIEKAEKIGEFFLTENKCLEELNIQNVEKIGEFFLYKNEKLKDIDAPNVETVNEGVFNANPRIREKLDKTVRKNKEKKEISSEDIARLAKEKQIKESEIRSGEGILEEYTNEENIQNF